MHAEDRSEALPGRPSWGALADALGHFILVFTLLPPLAALPGWLYGEVHGALTLQDRIVLAFLPARGALAVLDAFREGLAWRLPAGILAGLLLCGLAPRRGAGTMRGLALGALCGALGGTAAVGVLAIVGHDAGRLVAHSASAVVCGAFAAPGALRLRRGGSALAPQRAGASPSASHQ